MTDWKQIAEALDELRAGLRSMIAALVAEGFTDEQAHEIVTAFFRQLAQGGES